MSSPVGASLRRIADVVGRTDPAAASRVARFIEAIESAPESRRVAIASAVAIDEPALQHIIAVDIDAVRTACPEAYRKCPPSILARLLLGESPVHIAAKGLTRREAHAWLCAGAWDEAGWLVQHLCPDAPEAIAQGVRGVRVARWAADCWRDPPRREALMRPRQEMLAGRRVDGRYVDRLDEIRASDVAPGGSVEETFLRASVRLMARLEKALQSRGEPLCPQPRWWRPARCARLLRTGEDLVREGRDMRHCVATYAGAVKDGDSVIVGLCVLGLRSTVEIDPRGMRVRQHRGASNAAPPELCRRALTVLCKRWGVES